MDMPNVMGSWFPNNDDAYPGCVSQSDGAFALGYFAAISIETSHVHINLHGRTIQMHWHFYLQQRFFSVIEIAPSPFLPHVGPANFGTYFVSVHDVSIYNGEIGLSSHHGIHANNASTILIKDLKIHTFEVAGIALNGFANVTLKNIDIGPSFDQVPFTGYYSNARFLALALRLLLKEIDAHNKPIPFIPFAYLKPGDSISLRTVYEHLIECMDLAFRFAVGQSTDYDQKHPLFAHAIDLFINEEGLPDGSALYGIVLHSHNVAVGGFGQHLNEEGHGENVAIENVNIHDLKLKVLEVPAMYFDKCSDAQTSDITVLKGPFGDVMDLRKMVKKEHAAMIDEYDVHQQDLSRLEYDGNVLSDAQIALYLYRYYLFDYTNFAFTSSINDHFLKWAVRNPYHYQYNGIPSCIGFICNGDIMFHTNKDNVSPLASCACFNYSGPHDGGNPGTRERQGTMNTDVRAISITGGDVLMDGSNAIHDIRSCYGDTAAIDLMEDAILEFEEKTHLQISNVVSAAKMNEDMYKALLDIHKTPYPNNFLMCSIHAQDESEIINIPNDVYLYCKLPDYMTKYTYNPTTEPTKYPTQYPTVMPTIQPTMYPTNNPTGIPTGDPTVNPTVMPTANPTTDPTMEPTENPTGIPTGEPTVNPTVVPTANPTTDPTMEPTENPTASPTGAPVIDPTFYPTPEPTWLPTPGPI
eukprot:827155_1